jgi:hypothetical protein
MRGGYTQGVAMRSVLSSLFVILAGAVVAEAQTLAFDDDKAGGPPKGMTCALSGKGRPGSWKVLGDATAPSSPHVLAQTDADETGYRFPHCVADGLVAQDLTLSVRFKPVSGQVDQAAGLVWRYRDADNYYVVRANALENNVVLYKLESGRRTDLPLKGEGRTYGKKAMVASGAWSTLAVNVKGNRFEVIFNEATLYDVEDATFTGPGQVGVWTKADSVTHFDDLRLTVLK